MPKASRLVARTRSSGTGTQQRLGKGGAGFDQVLAVVQDQQQAPGPEVIREGLGQRTARLLANTQNGGHSLGHESRVGQRRQFHQPNAVIEPLR